MNIIGLTGKSGSGKSYFASKLGEKLGNSAVIKIDDIFSEVMNEPDIVSKIRDIYGEEVIKNGEVDLDTILSNKEIFNTIYEMIADRIEEAVTRAIKEAEEGKTEKDGTKTDKKENVILDWWGLPKSDLIAECDYVAYVDVDPDTRLQALKKRETRISQEDIDIRDDVLSVDYDSVDYDLVILNDHEEQTVVEAIRTIEEGIKRPSLKVNMHLDEFETRKQGVIEKQNERLRQIEPSKILAYKMLVNYKKIKNALELNGSFKKELALKRTPEEVEAHRRICEGKLAELLQAARNEFGESVEEANLQDILQEQSQEVLTIIEECREELKQVAQDTNLTINSCIYVPSEQLRDGKLETSKDVLNIAGELGNWVFAQSGTLVDNPYLLRKSGKGVYSNGEMCMPGDTQLLQVENGRATLKDPVYVYLMKTNQFEPVVSVDYMPSGEPAIRFEGEWTSEQDIDRKNMRVKKYTDVTEMLEYMQLFSAQDRETYLTIANMPTENREEGLRQFLENGKLLYINEECGINATLETPTKEGKSGFNDAFEDPNTTRTSVEMATNVTRENQQQRETTDKTIGE